MIERKYLLTFSASMIVVSLIFGMLSYFRIPYQFYLWEIFFEGKILISVMIIFFFYKKKWIRFGRDQFSMLSFNLRKNIALFFLPLLLYSFSIAIGLTTKDVSLNKPENAATLILATLFDIPAIYVFSVTTVFIEELIFRGMILQSFRNSHSIIRAMLFSSLLWTIFVLNEIVGIDDANLLSIVVVTFFFFSIGFFASALFLRNRSIIPGYSLRIGLITLTPIALSSRIVEADAFFQTSSLFFYSEGIITSVLLIGISYVLVKQLGHVTAMTQF